VIFIKAILKKTKGKAKEYINTVMAMYTKVNGLTENKKEKGKKHT
jgi:hypothetical protein